MADSDVYEVVRQRYADAARSSCADDCCDEPGFGSQLYRAEDVISVPEGAASTSLGCGNPTAVADLKPGETVLDLGSGAGIDVLLSAQRVGATGFAYGIDMTDEMLDLARKHAAEAGVDNVEFRKGFIEDIPLDSETVDVVISNCVINLSPDKGGVFSEMFRVLRPGGRLGIADVVAQNELSAEERVERGSWVGCIAGALSFAEYEDGLAAAGFTAISIKPSHAVAEGMFSAIIQAHKATARSTAAARIP
ncbi:MAG: methyltransferase domain-containing protein [Acidimicrobiia bacterium]|nr:MAG: methyltransferase domain-containing protein [Acidimicrobiia bacterium]